jgi:hypothetical protein
MARKYFRRQVLTSKIEATYGVDPVPTGAANAILAENGTLTPMGGSTEKRGYMTPYYGAKPSMRVEKQQKLEFDVELAGAGTAGTLPGYSPLLRACGMAAVQTVGTDVQYHPVSSGWESITNHMNYDGRRHALLGGRGDAVITLEKSKRPIVRYSFTSLWQAPTAVVLPAPTLTGFTKPLICNKTNTTVTLFGWAAIVRKLTFNFGNVVAPHFMIGDEEVVQSDRAMNGTIVVAATDIATFNPYQLVDAETLGPLHVVHGAVAGNIVDLNMATIQLTDVTLGETDGIEEWTIPFDALPTTGDDEFLLTVK